MLFSTFSINRSFISFVSFLTITIYHCILYSLKFCSNLLTFFADPAKRGFFLKSLVFVFGYFLHLVCAHTFHTSHSSSMSLVSTLSLLVLHSSLVSTNHTLSHESFLLPFFRWSCHLPRRSFILFIAFQSSLYWCSLERGHCIGFNPLSLSTLSTTLSHCSQHSVL